MSDQGHDAGLAAPAIEEPTSKGLTYGEIWDQHIKPFRAAVDGFSKMTIADVFVLDVWVHSTRWSSTEKYVADLQAGIARALEQLKKEAPSARAANRVKRTRAFLDRVNVSLIKGADCNTCPHWRERKAKKKGTRIPGGVGKCTRPEGHCRPSKVRE